MVSDFSKNLIPILSFNRTFVRECLTRVDHGQRSRCWAELHPATRDTKAALGFSSQWLIGLIEIELAGSSINVETTSRPVHKLIFVRKQLWNTYKTFQKFRLIERDVTIALNLLKRTLVLNCANLTEPYRSVPSFNRLRRCTCRVQGIEIQETSWFLSIKPSNPFFVVHRQTIRAKIVAYNLLTLPSVLRFTYIYTYVKTNLISYVPSLHRMRCNLNTYRNIIRIKYGIGSFPTT